MVNCSYKATCLSKPKILERCLLRLSRKQEKSLCSEDVDVQLCWEGKTPGLEPNGLKIKSMGMESQSFLLSVWPNSLAGTGSFCPQHASRLNERDPSNTEKYWRDFDVSCKPWRDLKHVWHWYGTNCTKLQRSTGTKSCRRSLALPFELVQPEPSETFSNKRKKNHQNYTGSVFPLPPQKILVSVWEQTELFAAGFSKPLNTGSVSF